MLQGRWSEWWNNPSHWGAWTTNLGPGIWGQGGFGLQLNLAAPASAKWNEIGLEHMNWNYLISIYLISTASGHRLGAVPALPLESPRSYLRSILLIYLKESNSWPAVLSALCISGSNTFWSWLSAAVKSTFYRLLFLCHICRSRSAIAEQMPLSLPFWKHKVPLKPRKLNCVRLGDGV